MKLWCRGPAPEMPPRLVTAPTDDGRDGACGEGNVSNWPSRMARMSTRARCSCSATLALGWTNWRRMAESDLGLLELAKAPVASALSDALRAEASRGVYGVLPSGC
mmetsp:Transcript_18316/g.43076  ORF Transcript_18316/g.43076 Transcript_18316/m.43076 type:complete len:106 (+) Transcript_18316:178-495(+)